MKLLIVEDDKNLNASISEVLKEYGAVTSCYNGHDALFEIEQNIYDLIVLDIMLPGIDGFEVLKRTREINDCPIIMLTAKDDLQSKVIGFELGADDYLTKPFYRDELIARVLSLLRRYNNNFSALVLNFHDLKIDVSKKSVFIKNEKLDISGKEYDLLEYFIRNKEIIITKEQLFNRIWGFECDTIWSVVEVYISNLRKILKNYSYNTYLKTIRSVGYLWSEK